VRADCGRWLIREPTGDPSDDECFRGSGPEFSAGTLGGWELRGRDAVGLRAEGARFVSEGRRPSRFAGSCANRSLRLNDFGLDLS